ncbi:MAG TPA: TlpA disulfide reductase family protein [Steroidobacteraceae bacterium]|nr:TlpA disulfide reductase family protein [Steroidobacteraceae bacterium]
MLHRIARIAARGLAALVLAVPALANVTGGPAPDFTLPARAGGTVSLDQFKGQVVMINFWASWCEPCRKEMPLLNDIYRQYGPMGFTLIGVNVEPERSSALAWLKQTPVSFPVLFDATSKVSQLYGVPGMPTTVFIDRKGNVRMLHQGYNPGDENAYLDEIRELIRE